MKKDVEICKFVKTDNGPVELCLQNHKKIITVNGILYTLYCYPSKNNIIKNMSQPKPEPPPKTKRTVVRFV